MYELAAGQRRGDPDPAAPPRPATPPPQRRTPSRPGPRGIFYILFIIIMTGSARLKR